MLTMLSEILPGESKGRAESKKVWKKIWEFHILILSVNIPWDDEKKYVGNSSFADEDNLRMEPFGVRDLVHVWVGARQKS